MRIIKYLSVYALLSFIIFILFISCNNDILSQALQKSVTPVETIYNKEAGNFICSQVVSTLNVTITWVNPIDSNFSNVVILRKMGSSITGMVDPLATEIYNGTDQTYADNGLTANKIYYYSIFTKNTNGLYSIGTKASVEIIPIKDIYSEDVTNFTALQVSSTTNINLTWTNPVGTGFLNVVVLRKTNSFSSSINDPLATNVYSGTNELFLDTGLTTNVVYYYTVFSRSIEGKYSLGKKSSIELLQLSSLYNIDVSNFSASQTPGTTNVSLNWTNPLDSNFSSVLLLRKTGGFPTGATDPGATQVYNGTNQTFLDTGLATNVVYYYTVFSRNIEGKYSLGKKSSIELMPLSSLYNIDVSNYSASQTPGTSDASLNWTNPSDSNFSSVLLLRKTDGFPTGATDPGATQIYNGTNQTYTDSGLTINTIYYYAIFCRNTDSNYSLGLRAKVEMASNPITPSTYNEVSSNFISVLNDTSINLSWVNPTINFSGVLIKRKDGSYPSAYNDSSSTTVYQGTLTSYLDNTGLVNNTTYYYCIYAKDTSDVYSLYPARSYKTFRTDFTPTVRNRCFYLIGGSSDYASPFSNLVSAVDAYDPVTDTIYANITSLPTPRYGCAVASANGKIYVFGGLDSNKNLVSTVDVLYVGSPTWPTNVWLAGNSYPTPKYMIRAENVNGKIYVFGGSSGYFGETTTTGPPTNVLNLATYFITNENAMYDTTNDNWIVDRKYVPLLSNNFMNFSSGVYNGNIFYAGGRYNTGGALCTGAIAYLQHMSSFVSITAGVGTYVARCAPAGVMYQKKAANGSDIAMFINCGGTTTVSTSEPIRSGSTNLTAVNTCYIILFPNPNTVVTPPTWTNTIITTRNLGASRAYAEAEYYGDYVYVFCGIGGSVLNTVERLYVDDTVINFAMPATAFPTPWTTVGTGTLSNRYAFDIAKIY